MQYLLGVSLLLLQHPVQMPVLVFQMLNLLRQIRMGRLVVTARQEWLHLRHLLELHLQTVPLVGQLLNLVLQLQLHQPLVLQLLLADHGDVRLGHGFVTVEK